MRRNERGAAARVALVAGGVEGAAKMRRGRAGREAVRHHLTMTTVASVLLVAPTAGEGEPTGRLAGHVARQATALGAALGRRHVEVPVAGAVLPIADGDAMASRLASAMATNAPIAADPRAGAVLVIPLAPQPSVASAAIQAAANAAASQFGVACHVHAPWHLQSRLLAALTSATYEALDAVWSFGSSDRASYDWALGSKMATPVVFVAPRWPRPAAAPHDEAYRAALDETAWAIAERLDLHTWGVSLVPLDGGAARDLEAWLEDLAERRETDVVMAPIASLADDDWLLAADAAGQEIAARLGMHLDRARSLNDDPVLIAALADLVAPPA